MSTKRTTSARRTKRTKKPKGTKATTTTKSPVYFAPAYVEHLTAENTLPPRFGRLLSKLRLKAAFAGQTVAVKIHEGTGVGFTTVRPIFLRAVIEALRQVGARPFLTGGIGWPTNSKVRGYTEETLGAPLFPAAAPSFPGRSTAPPRRRPGPRRCFRSNGQRR